jgi:hypothetical protein
VQSSNPCAGFLGARKPASAKPGAGVTVPPSERGDRYRGKHGSHSLWSGPDAWVRWPVSGRRPDSYLAGKRGLPRDRHRSRCAVAFKHSHHSAELTECSARFRARHLTHVNSAIGGPSGVVSKLTLGGTEPVMLRLAALRPEGFEIVFVDVAVPPFPTPVSSISHNRVAGNRVRRVWPSRRLAPSDQALSTAPTWPSSSRLRTAVAPQASVRNVQPDPSKDSKSTAISTALY